MLSVMECVGQGFFWWQRIGVALIGGLGDRLGDQLGIPNRREINKDNAIHGRSLEFLCNA
jgi:hypothetical protein